MADAKAGGGQAAERPLSPHLQIYRWTIPMALSILHRITGAALGAGTVLLAWWLISLARGPDAYAQAETCLRSLPGQIVLFGFGWALIYHLLNGIRHLFWDVGLGFAIPTAKASGWLVLILSAVLTLVVWFVGYGAMELQR